MVRECAASLLLLPAGCSYLLDFSDQAIPKAAPADAPYTQAACDETEPNDGAATAAVIAPQATVLAAICAAAAEDHDFYRFAVPATTHVEIRLHYSYRRTGDLDLRLLDRTGTKVVAESRGFGDEELITCPGTVPACAALAADDYLVEVFPAETGDVNAYTLALAITAM